MALLEMARRQSGPHHGQLSMDTDPKLLEILVCPRDQGHAASMTATSRNWFSKPPASPIPSATACRSCCRTKRASSATTNATLMTRSRRKSLADRAPAQSGADALTVAFDNGERFELRAEYLRVESPSAEVRGHGGSPKQIVLRQAGCEDRGAGAGGQLRRAHRLRRRP